VPRVRRTACGILPRPSLVVVETTTTTTIPPTRRSELLLLLPPRVSSSSSPPSHRRHRSPPIPVAVAEPDPLFLYVRNSRAIMSREDAVVAVVAFAFVLLVEGRSREMPPALRRLLPTARGGKSRQQQSSSSSSAATGAAGTTTTITASASSVDDDVLLLLRAEEGRTKDESRRFSSSSPPSSFSSFPIKSRSLARSARFATVPRRATAAACPYISISTVGGGSSLVVPNKQASAAKYSKQVVKVLLAGAPSSLSIDLMIDPAVFSTLETYTRYT